MKKRFKTFCMILLATIMVSVTSMPIVEAASNQLIIINSKKNTLNFYENNTLVRKFECATGKKSTPTPQRKTTVVNKIKNRPYYTGNIPGGDPRNPLGKRWLGLNMYGYGTTYGIHGTNNESSIGKYVSGGCIRMYNKDVSWLFDRVRIGANVIIKSTSNSDAWIASQYGINLKTKNSWYTNNGNKYYIKSDGKYATGWYSVNGNKYYFNSKGILQTGWQKIKGKTYYLGSNGIKRIGIQTISKKMYYFGSDGVRKTGWQTINGNKYYFRKSGKYIGQAYQDRKVKMGDSYNYFDKNGKMVVNKTIKIVENKKTNIYYFGKDGKMYVNKAGSTYYYGSDGRRVTSKNKIVSNYYLNGSSEIVKNKAVKVGTKFYYFGSYGKMYRNKSKDNYYYGNDGCRVYEKLIGNYYYGEKGLKVKNEFVTISSNLYYFGSNGSMYKNRTVRINNKTYSFDKSGIAKEIENNETQKNSNDSIDNGNEDK